MNFATLWNNLTQYGRYTLYRWIVFESVVAGTSPSVSGGFAQSRGQPCFLSGIDLNDHDFNIDCDGRNPGTSGDNLAWDAPKNSFGWRSGPVGAGPASGVNKAFTWHCRDWYARTDSQWGPIDAYVFGRGSPTSRLDNWTMSGKANADDTGHVMGSECRRTLTGIAHPGPLQVEVYHDEFGSGFDWKKTTSLTGGIGAYFNLVDLSALKDVLEAGADNGEIVSGSKAGNDLTFLDLTHDNMYASASHLASDHRAYGSVPVCYLSGELTELGLDPDKDVYTAAKAYTSSGNYVMDTIKIHAGQPADNDSWEDNWSSINGIPEDMKGVTLYKASGTIPGHRRADISGGTSEGSSDFRQISAEVVSPCFSQADPVNDAVTFYIERSRGAVTQAGWFKGYHEYADSEGVPVADAWIGYPESDFQIPDKYPIVYYMQVRCYGQLDSYWSGTPSTGTTSGGVADQVILTYSWTTPTSDVYCTAYLQSDLEQGSLNNPENRIYPCLINDQTLIWVEGETITELGVTGLQGRSINLGSETELTEGLIGPVPWGDHDAFSLKCTKIPGGSTRVPVFGYRYGGFGEMNMGTFCNDGRFEEMTAMISTDAPVLNFEMGAIGRGDFTVRRMAMNGQVQRSV